MSMMIGDHQSRYKLALDVEMSLVPAFASRVKDARASTH